MVSFGPWLLDHRFFFLVKFLDAPLLPLETSCLYYSLFWIPYLSYPLSIYMVLSPIPISYLLLPYPLYIHPLSPISIFLFHVHILSLSLLFPISLFPLSLISYLLSPITPSIPYLLSPITPYLFSPTSYLLSLITLLLFPIPHILLYFSPISYLLSISPAPPIPPFSYSPFSPTHIHIHISYLLSIISPLTYALSPYHSSLSSIPWITYPPYLIPYHLLCITISLFPSCISLSSIPYPMSPYPYSFLIYTPISPYPYTYPSHSPLDIFSYLPIPLFSYPYPYPIFLSPPIHPLLFISAHHLFSLLIYLHSLPMLLSPVTYPYPPSPITSISYHLG